MIPAEICFLTVGKGIPERRTNSATETTGVSMFILICVILITIYHY